MLLFEGGGFVKVVRIIRGNENGLNLLQFSSAVSQKGVTENWSDVIFVPVSRTHM